ncbi:MAG: hypothetical protein M1831_002499 [Alyxoria varia]|nr:MAG: hypothetical protein M1831_002499 [Alyxoria varia]
MPGSPKQMEERAAPPSYYDSLSGPQNREIQTEGPIEKTAARESTPAPASINQNTSPDPEHAGLSWQHVGARLLTTHLRRLTTPIRKQWAENANTKVPTPTISAQDLLNREDNCYDENETKHMYHYKLLLQHHEAQHKNLLLCFQCLAFHPLTLAHSSHPCCDVFGSSINSHHLPVRPIYFREACLVMRGNRLGGSRDGRPADVLSRSEVGEIRSSEYRAFTLRARPIDGRLLLREVWTSQPRILGASGDNGIPGFLPGCVHAQNSVALERDIRDTVEKFACNCTAGTATTSTATPSTRQPKQSDLFRCPWCPTEYRIQVAPLLLALQLLALLQLALRLLARDNQNKATSSDVHGVQQSTASTCNSPHPSHSRAVPLRNLSLKHILISYIWTDLERCLSPTSKEWAALTRLAPRRYANREWPARFSLGGLKTIESRYDGDVEAKGAAAW